MWNSVTEMVVVNTLVSTEALNLARSARGDTLLLITPIQTVCLPITPPGLRHTLPIIGTAEFIGPTSWSKQSTVRQRTLKKILPIKSLKQASYL